MMSRQIGMPPSRNNQAMARWAMVNETTRMLAVYRYIYHQLYLENVRNFIGMEGNLSELKLGEDFWSR